MAVVVAFLGAILLLHVLVSICLLRYGRYRPRLNLSQALRRVRVVAHRGCKDVAGGPTENTLEAFQHALSCGSQMLELDVHLSADGQVVVFHDKQFDRMCGDAGLVAERSFVEFPALVGGGRVPLLTEVLQVLPEETCLIVEVKVCSQELVQKVHTQLEQSGRLQRGNTVWFSLQESTNGLLRAQDPLIPTITSVEEMVKIVVAFHLGVLPYISIRADIFGIPIDKVDYHRIRGQAAFKSLPNFVCRWLALVFGGFPSPVLFNRQLNQHMNLRGRPVYVLGVDSEEVLPNLSDMGVNSLLTDNPAWLQHRLMDQSKPRVVLAELGA